MLNLQLTQQQKLVMTQQMQNSLHILQMPTIELKEYIEKEVENNVVLEVESVEVQNNDDNYGKMIEYLRGRENFYHEYKAYDGEEASPFLFIAEQQTFQQYLITQVIEQVKKPAIQGICFYIIGELDEHGFFITPIEEVAKALKVDVQEVSVALEIVQGLEPIGVGAKNIKQCLQMQVKYKNPPGKEMIIALIDQYLEDIANYQYQKLAKQLKISLPLLQQYIDYIKGLEPKPTRGFYTGETTEYIVPDAYIQKIDGTFQITINERYLPQLSIQSFYQNALQGNIDNESKEYIQKHIQSALFLIKNIEDRKRTLYRVIEAILIVQEEYFNGKSNYVKPMALKDIAQIIDMHESTVSRATQDKYIDIEKTTVRMKDLFTQAVTQSEEVEISVDEIKDAISKMIDTEDKYRPLSDQDICKRLLQEYDIDISRRTVAKYRQMMEILSSTQRKRF